MHAILKFLKDKVIKYSLLINLFYLVYFFIIVYNPTGGWGNVGAFINSIFYFPILILIVSSAFKSFKDKLKFSYLSFIIFGFIVSKELNLISFDFLSLTKLFALIISPIILALLSHIGFYILKKTKSNKKPKKK